MKFTFLTPRDNLGGGTRVVAIYGQLLRERGHEVMVICNAQDRISWKERLKQACKGRLSALWPKEVKCEGHIAQSGVPYRILETSRPIKSQDVPDADFVIATWWETAVWMDAFPASKGEKIHMIQGYEVWFSPEINAQVNAALKLNNTKIVISDALAQEINAEIGPLPLQVVNNGVDVHHFSAPPRVRHHPPRIGFIYAQALFKSADRYLAAINLARQTVPHLEVIAFGAEFVLPDMPLPAHTTYTYKPSQAEIPHLYAACDAWLFASRVDSFGLPILEAMACRTPVIGVPVGAAPALLSEDHGWLINISAADNQNPDKESEIVQKLATAIVHVCQLSDSTWQLYSERVYQRAQLYSWEHATEHLLETLKVKS